MRSKHDEVRELFAPPKINWTIREIRVMTGINNRTLASILRRLRVEEGLIEVTHRDLATSEATYSLVTSNPTPNTPLPNISSLPPEYNYQNAPEGYVPPFPPGTFKYNSHKEKWEIMERALDVLENSYPHPNIERLGDCLDLLMQAFGQLACVLLDKATFQDNEREDHISTAHQLVKRVVDSPKRGEDFPPHTKEKFYVLLNDAELWSPRTIKLTNPGFTIQEIARMGLGFAGPDDNTPWKEHCAPVFRHYAWQAPGLDGP